MKETEKQPDFNIHSVESTPLWEIGAAIDSRVNSKRHFQRDIANLFREGLSQPGVDSPWTKTMELMDERFYKNHGRAKNEGYAARAVINWSQAIEKEVDRLIEKGNAGEEDRDYLLSQYEQIISAKINEALSEGGVDKEQLENWRKQGGRRLLNNILSTDVRYKPEKRNTTSLRNFINIEYSSVIASKPHEEPSVEISADSGVEDISHKKSPSTKARFSKHLYRAASLMTLTMVLSGSTPDLSAKTPRPSELPDPDKNRSSLILSGIGTSDSAHPGLEKDVPQSDKIGEKSNPSEVQFGGEPPPPEKRPTPPEPDFVFAGLDLRETKQLTITIGNTSINTTPHIDHATFTLEEDTAHKALTASGTKGSSVFVDKEGNTYMTIHTGTHVNHPGSDNDVNNPGEDLRLLIQKGSVSNPTAYVSQEEEVENINKYFSPGTKVGMSQKNGVTREFEIRAVGIVPQDESEKMHGDGRNIIEYIIRSTGGEQSPFFRYKDGETGLFSLLCLHKTTPASGDQTKIAIDQTGPTLVIALSPTAESYHKNEAEKSEAKAAEQSGTTDLERSAKTLKQIMESAIERRNSMGEVFERYFLNELEKHGVKVTERMREIARDIRSETSDGDPFFCTFLPGMLRQMGMFNIPDLGGWEDENEKHEVIKPYDEAHDYLTNSDGEIHPDLLKGGNVSVKDVKIFKINSLNNVKEGDLIFVPRSPKQQNGHVAVVISVDQEGILIMDLNYDGRGTPRTEQIKNGEMKDKLAHGQDVIFFGMRLVKGEPGEEIASNN